MSPALSRKKSIKDQLQIPQTFKAIQEKYKSLLLIYFRLTYKQPFQKLLCYSTSTMFRYLIVIKYQIINFIIIKYLVIIKNANNATPNNSKEEL